jgi:hypothetical protein
MTALVALAMLADLVTFSAVIPVVGIGAELNPIMAQGYQLAGLLPVAALKLAALAATVLLVARIRRPRLRVLAAGLAIAVGLTGAAGNTVAWISVPRPAPNLTARFSPVPLPAWERTEGPTPPNADAPDCGPGVAGGPSLVPAAVSRDSAAGTISGIASTYGPGWDGWLALPEGPGVRVRICGAGGCVVQTSTDAGPSLAMQRRGRVADLDVPTFETVCGVPWTRGLCRVTVRCLS